MSGIEKGQEKLEGELKSLEYQEILEFLKEWNFNPEKPADGRNYLTPMEHRLLGSSIPGEAFHPNLAIAKTGGTSIKEINALREATNKKGDLFFGFRTPEGKHLQIFIDFLPLDETTIQAQEPVLTFRIRQPAGNHEQYLDDFKRRMAERQQEAREELFEKYNQQGIESK